MILEGSPPPWLTKTGATNCQFPGEPILSIPVVLKMMSTTTGLCDFKGMLYLTGHGQCRNTSPRQRIGLKYLFSAPRSMRSRVLSHRFGLAQPFSGEATKKTVTGLKPNSKMVAKHKLSRRWVKEQSLIYWHDATQNQLQEAAESFRQHERPKLSAKQTCLNLTQTLVGKPAANTGQVTSCRRKDPHHTQSKFG